MSLADHKGTQRGRLDASISFWCVCGEIIWLLLKYCIYCASAPSLHRESTDSLIKAGTEFIVIHNDVCKGNAINHSSCIMM